MSHNFNKQDNAGQNGKAFTDSANSSQECTALITGADINTKTDLLRLRLIYEELPNHCIQFFFLS